MAEQIKTKAPFLEVKDLFVEYYSKDQVVHAVNGVSFCLEKGETLGLVGETGAGKTSIAKAILRILPDVGARIAGGEVWLDGELLTQLSEEKMRKIRGNKISMIFQDPMTALNPVQKVGDQISEVVSLHNNGTKEDFKRHAEKMLEMVGIPKSRYDDYPHQFSGGMKQRVIIAIALACSPQLLLADEPTTALDVTIQAQVLKLIGELRQKIQTSMVLITHDMGVVATHCDYVGVVYAGNIVEYGTKEQVFDAPAHPYTIGLFGAIPNLNEDEEWLHPIDGLPPDPSNLPSGCAFYPRCSYATEQCKDSRIPMFMTPDGHWCRCCHTDIVLEGEEK